MKYLIKCKHDSFYLNRLTYLEMQEVFSVDDANAIIQNRHPIFYIEDNDE